MAYTVPYNEETGVSGRTAAQNIAAEAESQCGNTAGATFLGYSYDAIGGTVVVRFNVESATGPGDAYTKGDTIISDTNAATNAGLPKATAATQGRPT